MQRKQIISISFLTLFIFCAAIALHSWSSSPASTGATAASKQEAGRSESGNDREPPQEKIHTARKEDDHKAPGNSPISDKKKEDEKKQAPRENQITGKWSDSPEPAPPGEEIEELEPEPAGPVPLAAPPNPENDPKPAEAAEQAPESSDNIYDTYLNDYVQDIIATYEGYYPYLLNKDYANYNGVTENIYFDNKLLAKAHPSGNRANHCSGITFEVFFKAMQARNLKLGLAADDFNGMTYDDLYDFLLTWYAAGGNKQTDNIEVAVVKYGIGKGVSCLDETRPGDFMDISRHNGTGHTVVFQNWVRDNKGNIIGVHYWSSQGSTNGIAYNTEFFDISGRGNVCLNQVYIARVLPVRQYRGFR